ncbi:MAG: KilA-N domain-containing protein [Oscillatoria sp. SIO1A7]|nr:KilA-N domain-containing protein [Oscillatoria sp. SIO1A7]
MTATISREIYGTKIEQLYSNGYINLLQMAQCKRCNIKDYLQDKATQKFLKRLEKSLKLSRKKLILEETWGHPHVAIDFGYWCDRYLGMLVHQWVLEWNITRLYPIVIKRKKTIYLTQAGIKRLRFLKSKPLYIDSLLQKDKQKTDNKEYIATIYNKNKDKTFSINKEEILYSKPIKNNQSKKNNSSENSSGCFIVTACDADKYTLDIFYAFRNRVLLKNRVGQNLVSFYYKHSPPVAKMIKKSPLAKKIILELLIKPVAYLLGRFAL